MLGTRAVSARHRDNQSSFWDSSCVLLGAAPVESRCKAQVMIQLPSSSLINNCYCISRKVQCNVSRNFHSEHFPNNWTFHRVTEHSCCSSTRPTGDRHRLDSWQELLQLPALRHRKGAPDGVGLGKGAKGARQIHETRTILGVLAGSGTTRTLLRRAFRQTC